MKSHVFALDMFDLYVRPILFTNTLCFFNNAGNLFSNANTYISSPVFRRLMYLDQRVNLLRHSI